jgi:hypothetical protein
VEVTGVVGIYTNPNHVMAYDDGEVRQQCSICFTTRMLGGQLATSDETSEVAWVAADRLDRLNIHPVDAAADRPLPGTTGHALHRLTSPTVEPLPGPVDRRLQLGAGPNNRPVHRIIRWVAALHFRDALLQGHGSPVGPVVMSAKVSPSRTGPSSTGKAASSSTSPRSSASKHAPE